jgi:hypothetical protein
MTILFSMEIALSLITTIITAMKGEDSNNYPGSVVTLTDIRTSQKYVRGTK